MWWAGHGDALRRQCGHESTVDWLWCHGPHMPSYRWRRATGACGGAPTLWLGRMGSWQPRGARQRRRPRCPTPPTTAAGAGASRAAARRRSGGSCGQAPVLQGRYGDFSTCLLGAQLQEQGQSGWPQEGGRVGCVGVRFCCTVVGLGQVLAAGWRCRVRRRECPMMGYDGLGWGAQGGRLGAASTHGHQGLCCPGPHDLLGVVLGWAEHKQAASIWPSARAHPRHV